jgi:hypothetical protein
VVLVADDGLIVGLGKTGFIRNDVKVAHPEIQTDAVGWEGHVVGVSSQKVRAYLVQDSGQTVCKLSTAKRAGGPMRIGDFGVEGQTVQVGKISIAGQWKEDGQWPGVGAPPSITRVYGSWAGDDRNTGALTIGPIKVSEGMILGIPLVTGPRTEGLFIEIREHESGKVVQRLSPPVVSAWVLWEVELPGQLVGSHIDIVGTDNGMAWGQWLALGLPVAISAR